jgi:hypothetical protein
MTKPKNLGPKSVELAGLPKTVDALCIYDEGYDAGLAAGEKRLARAERRWIRSGGCHLKRDDKLYLLEYLTARAKRGKGK